MYKISTLKSGLKVLTAEIKGTEAITTLVMGGAGSRYETKGINGLSHFLEHMFFKGAKKYPDAKSVALAVDSIGGEFNAFTGKEYVGYYVTTPKEKYLCGFDVLSDMLLNSKFDPAEIEKERGVILEEINMYEDLPMQRVHEVFEEQIFGDTPLGWNIAGPKEVVKSLTREDFINYQKRQYTPNNLIVAVAGPVNHEEIIKEVENHFKFSGENKAEKPFVFTEFTSVPAMKIYKKETEQAHLILGVPTFGSEDLKRRYALRLLAVILGGNMSSRMFTEIREKEGLCYYIHTYYQGYTGAGYLATSAGVDLKRVNQAIKAIKFEYKKIAEQGILEEELINAKEYLKGKMTLDLENSESLAQYYAVQQIVYGDVLELAKVKEIISAIDLNALNQLANEVFLNNPLRLALIGPFAESDVFWDND